ncbi:hypothetical protein ACOXXX_21430 [Thalassococcus sp. BH17M4-6]|uniref:hypothetical protein n=1 Tax=Thalassococcus sp. BH17M4-6 TaxID=3413148 RepID=UPI003BD3888A
MDRTVRFVTVVAVYCFSCLVSSLAHAQETVESMDCSFVLNGIAVASASGQGGKDMFLRHPGGVEMLSPLRSKFDKSSRLVIGEAPSDDSLYCMGFRQIVIDGTNHNLIVSTSDAQDDRSGIFSVLFFSSDKREFDSFRDRIEENGTGFEFDVDIKEGLNSGVLSAEALNLVDLQVQLFANNARTDTIAETLPDEIAPWHSQNGRLIMVVCSASGCPLSTEAASDVITSQSVPSKTDTEVIPEPEAPSNEVSVGAADPEVNVPKQIRILGQSSSGDTPALSDKLNTPRMLFCLLDAVLDTPAIDARASCEGIDQFSEENRKLFAQGRVWLTNNDEFVFTPAKLRTDRLARIDASLPAAANTACRVEAIYSNDDSESNKVPGVPGSGEDSRTLTFELKPSPKFNEDKVSIVFAVNDEVLCGIDTHEVQFSAFVPFAEHIMGSVEFEASAAITIGLWNLSTWENRAGRWNGFLDGDVLRVVSQGLEAAHLQRADAFKDRRSALTVSSIATPEAGDATLALLTGSELTTNVSSSFESARSASKRRSLLRETSVFSLSNLTDSIFGVLREAEAANNTRLLVSLVGFPLEQAPVDVCEDEILMALAREVAVELSVDMDLRIVAMPFVRSGDPVSQLKPASFNPNLGTQSSEVYICPGNSDLDSVPLAIYPFVPANWRSQQDSLTRYGSALGDILATELIAISRPVAR